MRNGLFISPGVRINEIDQSIVPDLYSRGQYTVLMFILSDWGPEYYTITRGTKEFSKVFGTPKNIDTVSEISYDAQYRLSRRNCQLLLFRLNHSDDPADIQSYEFDTQSDTYIPISQKYSGVYGNYIRIKFYMVRSIIYVVEIYTQESQLDDPLLVETFTSRTLTDLIGLVNLSSIYINLSAADLTQEIFQALVGESQTELLALENGKNADRIDPETYITEDILLNHYEFLFTFLVNQAQLTSKEINIFQDLQYTRKDFVILTEFVPEEDDDLAQSDIVNAETGQPELGWEKWSRYVTTYAGAMGGLVGEGYTSRYRTGLEQSYLAIYHPWVLDTTNDYKFIPYPPSVHAMEIFLNVLGMGGELWEQMAGLNRGNLYKEPLIVLSKTDSDVLYLSNINPIVKFQGQGTYVWGQKTHYTRNSQLSRLNCRMVAIYIETNIQENMKSFLFEPMNQSTFSRISTSLTTFLSEVQARQGIIQFEFELDTRPEFIERNYLPIKIRFIPTKTLEFIEIRFVVKNYSQQL